jgi:hypothetical protein
MVAAAGLEQSSQQTNNARQVAAASGPNIARSVWASTRERYS